MCLINFNIGTHKKYKMIIAANRDESYERPTSQIAWWDDHKNIFGGRDLKANGTWLAVTKSGKIGALTNIRNAREMNKIADKSRGELIVNYLDSDLFAEDYLTQLKEEAADYAGYNLLLGNTDQLFYMNNYQYDISEITAGTHGVSNEYLNSPWPKVLIGKDELDKVLTKDDIDIESLFSLLRHEEESTDSEVQNTGVDFELEKKLSPLFINIPDIEYGTRCSSVILVDQEDNITFIERTFYKGQQTGERKETIVVKK